MKTRKRFQETMAYGNPDRVPYLEEGIRREVVDVWRSQGLPRHADIADMFPSDRKVELMPDIDPLPAPSKWPAHERDLEGFRRCLDPDDPKRLSGEFQEQASEIGDRDTIRMLRVHRGFFLTMGVRSWRRFDEVMALLIKKPDLIREIMAIQGRFAARLARRVLEKFSIDAAIFSEPIGGNNGPIMSPKMYEDLVLPGYEPLMNVLREFDVRTLVFRTYANAAILIPVILKFGFNCLWACEVNIRAMDYRRIREAHGRDLRLIGGIDLDALRSGPDAIKEEIEAKLPFLLADGGYIPLADGRVRKDVPYPHYVYYRNLLKEMIHPRR